MSDPLDELAEAWEHKTPGEWLVGQHPRQEHVCVVGGLPVRALTGTPLASTEADARFIALAGTHIGTLLERLRAAEEEVERLREALEQIATWDYQGHPHPSAEVARNALGEHR